MGGFRWEPSSVRPSSRSLMSASSSVSHYGMRAGPLVMRGWSAVLLRRRGRGMRMAEAVAVVRRGGRALLLLRRKSETGELGREVGEVDGSWSLRLLDVLLLLLLLPGTVVLLVRILRGSVALRMRGGAVMAGLMLLLLLLLRLRRPRRLGGRVEDLGERECKGTRSTLKADVRGGQ